ncbi:protein CWC15 [Babesia microti strain RI]|uniref:Protein CWC15 n=1 Tax=Babesia microti (strain RI) TaxID=1133968 RepID=I7IH73_BABMR|nr:protein CWC15 [Babesia microti strain RI]CCF75312.2 protein CWC15 [Babesia microti strain RI]|eukprot:XP_021337173.1 protein CWC15 [Babesia microti strain RI]
MTTAHRPTWFNAIGKTKIGTVVSRKISSRDLPGYKNLKTRDGVNLSVDKGIHRDDETIASIEYNKLEFQHKLELKEKEEEQLAQLNNEVPIDNNFIPIENLQELLNQDLNAYPEDSDDCPEFTNYSDDDKEDSDEEQELLKELSKIKQEKEESQRKREELSNADAKRQKILSANPILSGVLKSWDQDVVFKNHEKEEKSVRNKDYINDTVRSEFHKKFLEKYIV